MQKIPWQGLAHRFFPVPIKHSPLVIFFLFLTARLPFLLGNPQFIKYLTPPPPKKKKKQPPSLFPEHCSTELAIVSSSFFVANEFERL